MRAVTWLLVFWLSGCATRGIYVARHTLHSRGRAILERGSARVPTVGGGAAAIGRSDWLLVTMSTAPAGYTPLRLPVQTLLSGCPLIGPVPPIPTAGDATCTLSLVSNNIQVGSERRIDWGELGIGAAAAGIVGVGIVGVGCAATCEDDTLRGVSIGALAAVAVAGIVGLYVGLRNFKIPVH